jgi:hypothetical protein
VILFGAILLAVVVGDFAYRRYQPVIAEHLRVVSLQKTCLTYSVPRDKLVYQEFYATPNSASNAAMISASPDMTGFVVNNIGISWLCPTFLRYQTPTGLWSRDMAGLLFLHGRRAQGREERLVCIEINPVRPRADIPSASWTFRATVIRPATLSSPGARLWVKQFATIDGWSTPGFGLGVLGGQPDGTDESHFTIALPTLYPPRTIDGWLLPDDTVKLQVRPTDNKQQTTNPTP